MACDQPGLVSGAEVRDLVDKVERAGHESEIAPSPFRVQPIVELGDAPRQGLILAKEVVEVLPDRDVDGIADRRSPRVEVDENRPSVARKSEREVDGERGLSHAAFSGRNGNDSLDPHSDSTQATTNRRYLGTGRAAAGLMGSGRSEGANAEHGTRNDER